MAFCKVQPLKIIKTAYKITVRTIKTSRVLNSSCTLAHSANAKLNKSIIDRYLCLPIPECLCLVEYIWIDGTGENLRSKSRTLEYIPDTHKEIPTWSYDGNLTCQSAGKVTENILIPIALYNDPFRRGNNKLALCETYQSDNKPTCTNHRSKCVEAVNQVCDHEIMWGMEQQYHIMDVDGRPFGWPVMLGFPEPRSQNYCGVGSRNVHGRDVVETHYRACLYAGVQIAGVNAEANLSQWEYQVGTCKGIKGPDDLWMARYIMRRIGEEYGVAISHVPKLFPSLHGSGCHTNFSTKSMRADNGMNVIEEAINKLCKKHKEHLLVYDPRCGDDNRKRLTGTHETSPVEPFSHGTSDRSVSVRISGQVAKMKKGYLQDRRPAANCDPYQVCNMIIRTCLLE